MLRATSALYDPTKSLTRFDCGLCADASTDMKLCAVAFLFPAIDRYTGQNVELRVGVVAL